MKQSKKKTGDDSRQLEQGIRPYINNSMYWQFSGKPCLLLGGTNDDNLFQWAGDKHKLTDHLDLLLSVGGNYVRNTMSSRANAYDEEGNRIEFTDKGCVYPYLRQNDGKYDLDQWNDEYWHRLEIFLSETRSRDIIVQLELWDAFTLSRQGWELQPFNPANNVNYTDKETGLQEGWVNFYQYAPDDDTEKNTPYNIPFFSAVTDRACNSKLKYYQDEYIRKMLSITLSYDHVLYQIDNESPIPHDVSDYWAAFVHNEAAKRQKKVYVCDSRRYHRPCPGAETIFKQFQDWSNPEIHYPILRSELYNFCDISQNNGNTGQLHYDNLVWYRSHVLKHSPRPINHVKLYKWIWPTGTAYTDKIIVDSPVHATQRFWRAIFGGAASVRHHRVTWFADPRGLGLTPRGQTDIKSMRMFTDALDIFSMEPHMELLSARSENEAYAMAEFGRQLAVYFTGEANHSVDIDLASFSGNMTERWLNIEHSEWGEEKTVVGGGKHTFSAPDASPWALLLKKI